MKFKALPFIHLKVPNKKYQDFLLQHFDVGSLGLLYRRDDVLFLDWNGTDMKGWHKFVNPHIDIKIEFFLDEYKIHTKTKIFVFPFPKTLNDFLSDCHRTGVPLFWDYQRLDEEFDIKIYADEEQAKEYYKDLLTKIEKEDVF
jgi:hypothetical protein